MQQVANCCSETTTDFGLHGVISQQIELFELERSWKEEVYLFGGTEEK
jgi:hypothetical protein